MKVLDWQIGNWVYIFLVNGKIRHHSFEECVVKEICANEISEFYVDDIVFKDLDSAKEEAINNRIKKIISDLRIFAFVFEDKVAHEFVISLLENDPIAIDALKDVLKK